MKKRDDDDLVSFDFIVKMIFKRLDQYSTETVGNQQTRERQSRNACEAVVECELKLMTKSLSLRIEVSARVDQFADNCRLDPQVQDCTAR